MFCCGVADEAGISLDVQIRAHLELGWKHIEVRNMNGVNLTDLCDAAFEEAADKLSSAGIAVACFASQLCNWSRPINKHPDIDRQEFARAIPRMLELGCRYIRTMKNGVMCYTLPGEGDGHVRDVVRDLLARGYKGGFSIEPHLAAIVHEGKEAARGAYQVYVE